MSVKKNIACTLSGLALAFALPGCAAQTADAPVAAASTAPADIATPEPAPLALDRSDADPALWKVADADTTIYLFGTMHALRPDLVWFDDAVSLAFDEADELVIEMIEPDKAVAQAIIQKSALRDDGTTLSSSLTDAQHAKLVEAAETLGVPWAALEPMRPWYAAMSLAAIALNKLGYGKDSGAETVLRKAASERRISVHALETFEQQMGFFSSLPEADQIAFLMDGVEQISEMEGTFAELERAWAMGDVDATAALMQDGMDRTPGLFEVLLAGRNRAWAEWIDERLDQPGTVFVAVGAGHLAGRGSVQEFLAQRDIAAARVAY